MFGTKDIIMIKDTDLRKGNLVFCDNDTKTICEIIQVRTKYTQIKYPLNGTDKYSLVEYERLNAIPAEEGFLTNNVGFIKQEKVQFYQCYNKGTFEIFTENNKFYFGTTVCWVEIKGIHHLQNIFHALANGKELEIKKQLS